MRLPRRAVELSDIAWRRNGFQRHMAAPLDCLSILLEQQGADEQGEHIRLSAASLGTFGRNGGRQRRVGEAVTNKTSRPFELGVSAICGRLVLKPRGAHKKSNTNARKARYSFGFGAGVPVTAQHPIWLVYNPFLSRAHGLK